MAVCADNLNMQKSVKASLGYRRLCSLTRVKCLTEEGDNKSWQQSERRARKRESVTALRQSDGQARVRSLRSPPWLEQELRREGDEQ